ncbi:tetratricopeptide repeat protein [Geobacter argillaceus]|uniref:Tetratricopeptide repeat protein n=1 Tax=Geobacter argillaceus TaxID=345631 RepID=A0A562VNA3_9BACT|nr:hypothetical protein [Geobacter argillaceus]TWJ19473.1 hypothetical protein JN12_01590 [Geobacter argillaceus]
MTEKVKTVAVNVGVACVIGLIMIAVTIQYRQWRQFGKGEKALAVGDYIQAVAGFESAIHLYTPGSPLVSHSAEKLWQIGETLERQGDTDKALIAYRALRSSFYAAHWLITPGQSWIARCDGKIAQLTRPAK